MSDPSPFCRNCGKSGHWTLLCKNSTEEPTEKVKIDNGEETKTEKEDSPLYTLEKRGGVGSLVDPVPSKLSEGTTSILDSSIENNFSIVWKMVDVPKEIEEVLTPHTGPFKKITPFGGIRDHVDRVVFIPDLYSTDVIGSNKDLWMWNRLYEKVESYVIHKGDNKTPGTFLVCYSHQ